MEIADEYAEMQRAGIDVAVALFLPDDEVTERCLNYEDILRVVCSHLELPQSESGPADDLHLYDRALEAADLYTKQADADLAENKRLRFAAEAAAERLAAALRPFADVASKLPDPKYVREDSAAWASAEMECAKAVLTLSFADFRKVAEVGHSHEPKRGEAA
jgi:hypothetical protein